MPKSSESHLDGVSTGSGSDLVSEQCARLLNDFDSVVLPGRYRSLY